MNMGSFRVNSMRKILGESQSGDIGSVGGYGKTSEYCSAEV